MLYAQEIVSIGVMANRGIQECVSRWSETARYLSDKIQGYSFKIVPLEFHETLLAAKTKRVDFILANPVLYVELELKYGASRIATLKNNCPGDPCMVYGGTVIASSKRDDIHSFKDLIGKSFAAVSEESLGGWYSIWYEMKVKGIDPFNDFLSFTYQQTHDAVVYAVRDNQADAGGIRTGLLEMMVEEGKIRLEDFKVIHNGQYGTDPIPFLHSTRSYPEWPMAKLSHIPDDMAKRVLIALLEMTPDHPAAIAGGYAGWSIPQNYQSIHECLKLLQVGPYKDFGKVKPEDIVRQYSNWVLIGYIFMILLITFTFYSLYMNRKLEYALVQESRLAAIVNSSNDAITSTTVDGIIQTWNKGAEQIYGYAAREAIGKSASFLFPKNITDRDMEIIRRVKNGESFGRHETERLRKDGSKISIALTVFPVFDSNNRILGISAISRDISDLKRAEEERRRLAAAIQQSGESVIIADYAGTILYVNPAFENMTGFTKSEAIGKNPRILNSGKQRPEFYREMWKTITGGNVWRGRHVNQRKDGVLFEVDTSISPVTDNSGNIINFVSVSRDITLQMKLETQLRKSQKIQAIGTLAGGIAHDFNNILFPIFGYAQMTMDHVPDGSIAKKNLEKLLIAANRARDLVQQILAFSRQTEQERRPLQLQPIIKESLKLLQATLPKTISIHQNIAKPISHVLADATQMHQILMNLCMNAYHAMKENGGVLNVSLDELDIMKDDLTLYPELQAGKYMKISVTDTGHGMDPAIVDKIFDPFFTTKPIGEGTGLGLSVVHGIVKSYDGHISVYSEPDVGTTFNVYLPCIDAQSGKHQPSIPYPIPRGTEHVLVVDDESLIVSMLDQMLTSLGYRVTPKTSSISALNQFMKTPNDFDLVITDQTMPEMTGSQLVQRIMEIRNDIPTILCTGFSETMPEEKARELGIHKYVMKPIIISDLAKAIRKVLDGK